MNNSTKSLFKKEWICSTHDDALVEKFEKELSLPRAIIKLLINKGFDSAEDMESFLNPSVRNLHNPFHFVQMEGAVLRIRKALDTNQKILVYGDRDMDGITALSIMLYTLKVLGGDVEWHLNREEGYGMSRRILEDYINKGIGLVITVDCGITAVNEVGMLVDNGIDTIVTDHHQPQEELPQAFAIINPHMEDSGYPFSNLAGCGVSFKVMQALMYTFARDFGKKIAFFTLTPDGIDLRMIRNGIPVSDTYSMGSTDNGRLAEALSVLESAEARMILDIGSLEKVRETYPEIFDKFFEGVNVNFLSERFPATRYLKEYEKEFVTLDRLLELYLFEEMVFDLRMRHFMYETVGFAALGTIADLVSMAGENRTLVNSGLSILAKSRNTGLKALFEYIGFSSIGDKVSSKELSWKIIPLLNSCGRCSRPELAVELLLANTAGKARELTDSVMEMNTARKSLQEKNRKCFEEQLDKDFDPDRDRFIFSVVENLDHGVTGIVANFFLKRYHRPVFLLIKFEDGVHGTSRAPQDMPVLPVLEKCSDILTSYGGHPCAAGFRLKEEDVGRFKERVAEIFSREIDAEDVVTPKIKIDAELENEEFSWEFVEILRKVEPYGTNNAEPVFMAKGAKLVRIERIGADKNHMRLGFKIGGKRCTAMGWDFGEIDSELKTDGEYDIVFNIEPDYWKKDNSFRLVLKDIAHTQREEILV